MMMQRRIFLGSVALGTAHLFAPQRTEAMGIVAKPRPLNWQCEVIKTIAHTKSHRNPVVTGVDIRSAGDIIAVVGDDHVVCLYNIAQREFTHHIHQHTDWVRTTEFSPDGKWLATAGNDRKLLISSLDRPNKPSLSKSFPSAIINIAWSHDGSKIATVGFDRKLRIFDPNSGEKIGEAGCACNDNHAVAFSQSDSLIAVGGRSGNIKIWNTNNLSEVADFKHHRQRVRDLQFTDDNKVLSVSDDQTVCLTDPLAPAAKLKLPRQSAKLFAAQILSGNFFATAGSDNGITIWGLSDMTTVGTLGGHTGTVSCLAAANGTLVSGSFDATLRIWKPELETFVQHQDHRNIDSRQTRNVDGWQNRLK